VDDDFDALKCNFETFYELLKRILGTISKLQSFKSFIRTIEIEILQNCLEQQYFRIENKKSALYTNSYLLGQYLGIMHKAA
jgi:hypothetical protein